MKRNQISNTQKKPIFQADEDQPMNKPPLTKRELQCLAWASKGKTSWETAIILGLSESTVNFHLRNASRKLNVYGRQACIAQAWQLGLLNPTILAKATQ
jgi:LuxR family transcriptional regulator of spore coat protein